MLSRLQIKQRHTRNLQSEFAGETDCKCAKSAGLDLPDFAAQMCSLQTREFAGEANGKQVKYAGPICRSVNGRDNCNLQVRTHTERKLPMQGKIIPFGYANGGLPELERLMTIENAYLVDIRLLPRSKYPAFNLEALQARFPKRYVHMPELGNRNYHNGGPIQIVYAERGIARLVHGINQGYTLVLMCRCKEYERCHRRTVIEMLTGTMSSATVIMPEEVKP